VRRRHAKVKLARAALRTAEHTSWRYTKYLQCLLRLRCKINKECALLGQLVAKAERTAEVGRQTLLQTQDELDREMRQAGVSDLPDEAEEPEMSAPVSSCEEVDSSGEDLSDD